MYLIVLLEKTVSTEGPFNKHHPPHPPKKKKNKKKKKIIIIIIINTNTFFFKYPARRCRVVQRPLLVL